MSKKSAPYKIACVAWEDAHHDSSDDLTFDETEKQPLIRHSVGWLVRRKPVVLVQTVDRRAHSGELLHASSLTIPRSLVKVLTTVDVEGTG